MEKEIEEKFVNTFIVKEKRNRILFELCSNKKRGEAIQKLIGALDDRYNVFRDSKVQEDEFLSVIKKYYDINKTCYVIADDSIDGKVLPFKTALNFMMESGGVYVLVCGDNLIIAKEEYCYNTTKLIFFKS